MKKRFSVILALSLVILMLLVACGGGSGSSSSSGGAASSSGGGASSGGGGATSGGSGTAASDTVVEMVIANQSRTGYFCADTHNLIAELLEEQSGGRFSVKVFEAGSFGGPDHERMNMLLLNTIQMTCVPAAILSAMSHQLAPWNIYDLPYLFEDHPEVYAFFEGEIGQELNQLAVDAVGVMVVDAHNMGVCAISSNTPIRVPADIEGLKIRVGQLALPVESVRMWGAVPSTIDFAESYTALQQGAVDGTATSLILWEFSRWYEVQDYVVMNNYAHMPHFQYLNKGWYDALPDDLRVIFDDVIAQVSPVSRQWCQDFEDFCIEWLGTEMEMYFPTPAEMELWRAPARDMWRTTGAESVGGIDFLNRAIGFMGFDPV